MKIVIMGLRMKNRVIIVNTVCYIIIFICILFISMPLILKYFMPESSSNNINVKMLWCKKSTKIENKNVKINYNNKKITSIIITYENVNADTVIEEKRLIDKLGVSYKSDDNNIAINVEENAITKKVLPELFEDINMVKNNYEIKDYSCSIITAN